MVKDIETVVTELNDISAALEFLSDAIESHESEGKSFNGGGVAYLVRVISQRSSKVSDICWSIKINNESELSVE